MYNIFIGISDTFNGGLQDIGDVLKRDTKNLAGSKGLSEAAGRTFELGVRTPLSILAISSWTGAKIAALMGWNTLKAVGSVAGKAVLSAPVIALPTGRESPTLASNTPIGNNQLGVRNRIEGALAA